MSDRKKPRFSSSNAPVAQGGRSPTEATGAIRVDKGRWSSGRKRDVVLRILRGETLDALGCDEEVQRSHSNVDANQELITLGSRRRARRIPKRSTRRHGREDRQRAKFNRLSATEKCCRVEVLFLITEKVANAASSAYGWRDARSNADKEALLNACVRIEVVHGNTKASRAMSHSRESNSVTLHESA